MRLYINFQFMHMSLYLERERERGGRKRGREGEKESCFAFNLDYLSRTQGTRKESLAVWGKKDLRKGE